MTLSELLESKFRADIRFRGQAYVKAERVSVVRVHTDHLMAVVRDGTDYETLLSREDGALRMHCSCNTVSGRDFVACKHLWATVLAVDEGSYLTGLPRPGNIPPFAVQVEASVFDDDWDDDVPEELVSSSMPVATKRKPVAEPKLRDWEKRLLDLRQSMNSGAAAASPSTRERQVFYEIDVEASREVQQLVLQTSQRQRRASGQWGKLKPLRLRPGRFDDLDATEDRQILARLAGGTPDRANWYAQQNELQAALHRYRLPYELALLVIPEMCATGRTRLLDGESGEGGMLTWDDEGRWEFVAEVILEADEWTLRGRLERGDEQVPLSAADLIVPGGLVVMNGTIARLNDFDAFSWLPMLDGTNAVRVDNDEGSEFVDRLLDMPCLPHLHLPESLRLEEVEGEPRPKLIIQTPQRKKWQSEKLSAELRFDYLGTEVRGSSNHWAIVQRELGRCLIRNRTLEDVLWGVLSDAGFRRRLEVTADSGDVEIHPRDLGAGVRKLIELGWEVRADDRQVVQPTELQFRVQSDIDWFELHADVKFQHSSISFPRLLAALAKGETTIRLDDGTLGILPEEWIRKYGMLAGLGTVEDEHVRFAPHQIGLLDALLATSDDVDYDSKFEEMRQRLRDFSGVGEVEAPEGFDGELREYQKEGLGWLQFLQEFNFGGCLADDMGLGKTIQVLAMLESRRHVANRPRPSLVIVPKSLLFNWQQEAARFTPALNVLEYIGVERSSRRELFPTHDLILTTYGTLRRDIAFLKDVEFDYVILDEAQAIKNSGSQVAKASRLLNGRHRVALSGTPIENHISDLYSIFDFLNPGMLGRSTVFKLAAGRPEDTDMRQMLSNGLKPFILRRTKRGVAAELPEKTEQTIFCRMGTEQRKLYDELRQHYRDSLLGIVNEQGLAKAKFHVLEALLRLRQAACHPALLDRGSDDEPAAKLETLCPQLEELLDEGHKSLVFSQFTSMLAIVRKHLDKRGIRYEYLDGQTRDRKSCVENFQNDPDVGVFLISLKAGGLGLNLTAADYVFLLDPWWNPAVEMQAIDRAHRVGQTRPVFAYRLICRDTVEEKIANLQKQKRELAEAILEENNGVLSNLTAEDLEMLLS